MMIFPFPDDLGPDDLCSVMEAIFSVHPKWYNIGLKLHISFMTLNGIKANFKMTDECLREMLIQWLTRTSPPPSWSGLVEALSSVLVGEKRLAEQIHTQYCVPHDVTDSGDVETGTIGMNMYMHYNVYIYIVLYILYIHVCMYITCTCYIYYMPIYIHAHVHTQYLRFQESGKSALTCILM